jgi:dTDP-4-dehydrorhamnose 3,5-epimerase
VRGVRFDDPAFGIAWPLPATVVSEQDRNWPLTDSEAATAEKAPTNSMSGSPR